MALEPGRLMIPNRLGILSLLTVVALGLLGLSATTAHADAQWRIIGTPLKGEEKEAVAITGNTSQILEVAVQKITITCTGLSLDSGVITDKPGGHFQGTLLYTSCTTKSNGKEAPFCNPLEKKITATALGLLAGHTDGKTYLLLQPLSGKPLATIQFSELCALAETTELTGQMVAECVPVASCEEEKITHTLKANETGLFSDQLKFGKNTAAYKGEITLELGGKNKGQKWNGFAQGPAGSPVTVLCTVEIPGCPEGAGFAAESSFSASLHSGTAALFETSSGNIECSGSAIDFQLTKAEGEPLPGSISKETFTGCALGKTECTVGAANLPYALGLSYTKEGDASLSIANSGKGEPLVSAVCEKTLNCEFYGEQAGAFEGNEPGEIVVTKDAFSTKGSICPEKATFTAAYALTSPKTPAFAAQQNNQTTKLCKAAPAPNNLRCPNNPNDEGYPGAPPQAGIVRGKIIAGTSATFTVLQAPTKKVSCSEAEFAGEFLMNGRPAPGANGGITTLKYTGGGGGACSSANIVAGNPGFTLTMLNTRYANSYIIARQPEGPQGSLGIASDDSNARPVRLLMEFTEGGNPKSCEYRRTILDGSILNTTVPVSLTITGTWLLQAGTTASCPAGFSQSTVMSFKRPNPNAGQPDLELYAATE